MNLQYWRDLKKKDIDLFKKTYENHLKIDRGGLTSKKFRQRLLGLKLGKRGDFRNRTIDDNIGESKDSQFWFLIKESVRYTLNDLRLISEVSNEKQIREMFQVTPYVISEERKKQLLKQKVLSKDEEKFLKENKMHVSLDSILNSILNTPRGNNQDEIWKSILVREILKICIKHLKQNEFLMTKSHIRLLDELEDLMEVIVGVSFMTKISDKRRIVS